MVFHNNKLVEIALFDVSEAKHRQSRPHTPSRTSAGDYIKQEETPDERRKRMETFKIQTLHEQPAVDAARAADMDHIHFSEPFQGFDFPSTNAYNLGAHFHEYSMYHPWAQAPRNGGAFYNESMPESSDLSQSLSGDTLVPLAFFPESLNAAQPTYDGDADTYHGDIDTTYAGEAYTTFPNDVGATYHGDDDPFVDTSFSARLGEIDQAGEISENYTQDEAQDYHDVSATPPEESRFATSESEDERPRKLPKLNKDGAPRKPRQPRVKLLKWTDDDWKNVCLGIVWACGETGLQIPFEQAAQVVGEKCTAGALQQALLKLRGKQVAEGHQIPNLRMAWTRKNKYAASGGRAKASQEPEANKVRKKATRVESTQALVVTVPRAYNERDRQGVARPYRWKKPSRKAMSSGFQSPANMKQEDTAAAITHPSSGGIHDYSVGPQTPSHGIDYLPATQVTSHHTSFGHRIGYLQGMDIVGEEYTRLLTTEGLHELGNGFADASDDVFST